MIIGFFGTLGRGKTLTMTFLLYLLDMETRINNIVTNYDTDITTHRVSNPKELDDLSQREGFKAIYGIDEIWAWMNARKTQENFDMVEFVLNSRKRGCAIIYTTQSDRQVDPILIDNTDYQIVPLHKEAVETSYDHDVVEVYVIQTDTLNIVNKITINAEIYYNTYDTSEEISSNTDKEEYKDTMIKLMNRFIDGTFKSKKDAVSFCVNNDIFHSGGKAERIVSECIARLMSEGYIRRESNMLKSDIEAIDDKELESLLDQDML